MVMHRPHPDGFIDAVQAGEIPWDYDVDLWAAERDLDEQMAAADLWRKEAKEGDQ